MPRCDWATGRASEPQPLLAVAVAVWLAFGPGDTLIREDKRDGIVVDWVLVSSHGLQRAMRASPNVERATILRSRRSHGCGGIDPSMAEYLSQPSRIA